VIRIWDRKWFIVIAVVFSVASFVLGFTDKSAAMAIGAMLAVVFLFMAHLDDLEEFVVSLKEMRIKRRREPTEEVAEDGAEQEMQEAADDIRDMLRRRGAHSFQYFRDHTRIKLSDEEFDELIRRNPEFKKVTIIQRDEDGNRIIPGRPGIKLDR
jgi:hypothetical protein